MNFWEILLILMVALVVIKPERLPEIAYAAGRFIAKARAFYQKIMQQFSI